MFSDCPSAAFVRWFVRADLVTTISHERLGQSRWNIQGIFKSLIDDQLRLWMSNFEGQGHIRPSRWRRHPCRRLVVKVPSSNFHFATDF